MNNFKKIAADAAEKYTSLGVWNKDLLKESASKSSASIKEDVEQMDEADELRARGGLAAVNKKPRSGQTDMRNIPVGNHPGARINKFTDKDREEQPGRLKAKIKATLGKHTRPNLPEEVEQMDEAMNIFHQTSSGAQMKRYAKDSPAPEARAHRNATAAAAKDLRASGALKRKSFSYGSTDDIKTSKGGTVMAMKREEVDAVEEMSDMQMKKREDTVKSMKKNFGEFRKRYGEKAKSVMYATATKQAMKEDEDQEEQYVEHLCAQHVYHDVFGEGVVLEGEHAVPDENGDIEWYTVEFPHGKETVHTEDVKIMHERMHGHMMKKKKKMMEEEELDEMSSKMKMKLGLYGKKKKMMEEDEVAEANDGNLANNAPPYDKVTHGDVITGRLGKDHQGGKSKFARERSKYQAKGASMGPGEMLSKLKGMK